MSRRSEAAAGKHAGERLLSSLGGGTQDSGEPDTREEAVFVYAGTAPAPSPTPATSQARTSAIRFRTGLRTAVLIAVLSLVGAGSYWWQALAGRTDVVPLSAAPPQEDPGKPAQTLHSGEPGPPSSPDSIPKETPLVVHVAGAVNSPGVVSLPAGSRVHDAISAAGGPLPVADPGALNLAAIATDGQRIYVPRPDEVPMLEPATDASSAPGGGGTGSVPAGAKINLNTATPAELATLPKVGPVLAQNIANWRLEHGPFATVEELDAVDGIGPKMLETLLPLVTL